MCGLCNKIYKIEIPKLLRRKNNTIESVTTKTKHRVVSKPSNTPSNNFSAKYLGMLLNIGYKKKEALDKIRQVQSLNLKSEQEIINRLLTK